MRSRIAQVTANANTDDRVGQVSNSITSESNAYVAERCKNILFTWSRLPI